MEKYLIVLVILYLSYSFSSAQHVQVNIAQGTLQGEVLPTVTGEAQYYSFKGIPYAAPPVGSLRFRAPQPPLSWEGVRNATEHGALCPQVDIFTLENIPGSEDCLFLNVYTPNLTPNRSLPVMVFIHGGGFTSGSGNEESYGPDFLMTHDVVLVTINYRLEVLGFLSLGTEEVPGNAGLKDQVAALRWVRDNIIFFGGDPDIVTIFGQSAGSASVAYHLLSPMSRGLFRRAIGMSGVPFNEFATEFRPVQRAFLLGAQLGINTNDTTVLLNYLRSVSTDRLYGTNVTILSSEAVINNLIKLYSFVPVVEKDFGNGENFLTQDPEELLRSGAVNPVDMIFGYTNGETLTVVDVLNSTYAPIYERYPETLTPLRIYLNYSPEIILDVAAVIKQHYFDNRTINEDVIEQFVDFNNDISFVHGIQQFIANMPDMPDNSRFLYKFSIVTERNVYGNRGQPYGISGAGHLDDTLYLFDAKALNLTVEVNSTVYELIHRTCTLFSNFAKYGDPTPDSSLGVIWEQYDSQTKNYLENGNELSVGTAPDADVMSFWQSIYESVGLDFYY